ncbi:cation diffusion facilitator family transporter, partial [Candidatus Sumerlaeota bacterium]
MSSDHQQLDERATTKSVRRILWVILFLNLGVAAAKLIVGWLASSLTVLGDGLHSLLDGMSNVIGLIGIHLAAQPPDDDHPYGHRKFEALAALAIAGMMLLTSWEIGRHVVVRAVEGAVTPVEATPLTFAVILITMLINIGITVFERARGRRLNSTILLADAMHTLSDVFVSALGLLVICAALFEVYWLDQVGAVVIAGLILFAAVQIVRRQALTLSDAARIDPAEIERVALTVEDVIAVHDIRSRGPEGQVWVDLHMVVDRSLSAERVYAIEHAVQSALRREFPEI